MYIYKPQCCKFCKILKPLSSVSSVSAVCSLCCAFCYIRTRTKNKVKSTIMKLRHCHYNRALYLVTFALTSLYLLPERGCNVAKLHLRTLFRIATKAWPNSPGDAKQIWRINKEYKTFLRFLKSGLWGGNCGNLCDTANCIHMNMMTKEKYPIRILKGKITISLLRNTTTLPCSSLSLLHSPLDILLAWIGIVLGCN